MSDVDTEEPQFQLVKARDVIPYHWALWCTVGDSKPFANVIVMARWSEDGKRIVFMLDTHNFDQADPDEELELVPCDVSHMSSDFIAQVRSKHARTIGACPPPLAICSHCKGTGKIGQGPWPPSEGPS